MKLLVDTDAFCKLGVANLFEDAVTALGLNPSQCRRLSALPHMLRRGRLREAFGASACDALLPLASSLSALPQPEDVWLDKLTGIASIDPGEAEMYAAAAEGSMLVLSGDKRALRALSQVAEFPDVLAGRVIELEAILIALCDSLGADEVRCRIEPVAAIDTVFQICFSAGSPDPREALLSYYDSFATEVCPIALWTPLEGGRS